MARPERRSRIIRHPRTLLAAFACSLLLGATVSQAFTNKLPVGSTTVFDQSHTIGVPELIANGCTGTITSIKNGATNTYLVGSSGNASEWLWNAKNQTTSGGGGNLKGGNQNDCMIPGAVRNNANLGVDSSDNGGTCYIGPSVWSSTNHTYNFNTGHCAGTSNGPPPSSPYGPTILTVVTNFPPFP
jgi:hypothetical protein